MIYRKSIWLRCIIQYIYFPFNFLVKCILNMFLWNPTKMCLFLVTELFWRHNKRCLSTACYIWLFINFHLALCLLCIWSSANYLWAVSVKQPDTKTSIQFFDVFFHFYAIQKIDAAGVREGASLFRSCPDANKCGGGYLATNFEQLIVLLLLCDKQNGTFDLLCINWMWLLW